MAGVQIGILDLAGQHLVNEAVPPTTTLLSLKRRLLREEGAPIPSITFADLDPNPVNLDDMDNTTVQEVLNMKADLGVPALGRLNLARMINTNYPRTFEVSAADGSVNHILHYTPSSQLSVGDLKNLVIQRAAQRDGIMIPLDAEWWSNTGLLNDDNTLLNTLHAETEDAVVPIVIMNSQLDGRGSRHSHRNKLKSKRTRRTREQKKRKRRRRRRKTRENRSKMRR